MSKLITPHMAYHDQRELSGLEIHAEEDEWSLNDEFSDEISPLNVIKNGNFYQPYSFADIEENIGTITSLENRISDLNYLIEDINKTHGMNQTFAMEAEKILPGFGGVPIEYYSKVTSATRYKIAIEEISNGIWALIAAMAVALVAAIYKFIKWAFGGSSSSSSGSSNNYTADDLREIEKKVETVIKEIEPLKHDVYPVIAGLPVAKLLDPVIANVDARPKSIISMSIDGLLHKYLDREGDDSHLAQVMYTTDPMLRDLMIQGEYFKTIMETGKKHYIDIMKKNLDESVDRIKKISYDLEHIVTKAEHFNLASAGIINQSPVLLKGYGGNFEPTTADIVSSVVITRDRVISAAPRHHYLTFSSVFLHFMSSIKGSGIIDLIDNAQSLEDSLISMTKVLDDCAEQLKKPPTPISEKARPTLKVYSQALKDVISSSRDELKNVMKLVKILQDYANFYGRVGDDIVNRFLKESLRVIETEVKESGSELSDDLRDIHTILKGIPKIN